VFVFVGQTLAVVKALGSLRNGVVDINTLMTLAVAGAVGAPYKLNPADPWLESASFQPLRL
jgi:cation transport ATPase